MGGLPFWFQLIDHLMNQAPVWAAQAFVYSFVVYFFAKRLAKKIRS